VVGYELGKLGYDYQVLEAREWVGGLCWTIKRGATHTEIDGDTQVCQFDEGLYLNGGAWRLPNADTGVLGYCAELGVGLEIFVDATDANYFYEKNPELGPLSGRKVRLREVKADLWGSTSELLAKAMDQGRIDAPLSTEDKERLVSFLVRAGYLDTEDHVYRPPSSRGSADRHDLGALLQTGFGTRVRSLYAGIGGPAPVFQPVGGMMEIPLAFERAMGDRVTLNAEVRSIRQTADAVRVVYRNTRTGQEQEETAAYCVCCLPMAVLQRIDITLSTEMAEAVNATGHSTAAKMGLQMARRFWEEDEGIFGGHLWSRSLQLGEFSCPSNDYFSKKGVVLGFYGNGEMAGLSDQSIEARVGHVLTQSSKVHAQMREEFESAYAVWWEKVPYSLGAPTAARRRRACWRSWASRTAGSTSAAPAPASGLPGSKAASRPPGGPWRRCTNGRCARRCREGVVEIVAAEDTGETRVGVAVGDRANALDETAAELDVGTRRQTDRRRLVESPGGVDEAERLPVGCVECDLRQFSSNVVREHADRVDLRCCIGLQPFFVDLDQLAEVEQRLPAEAMPMRVGEAARHERHAHLAPGGYREGDAGSAGLQPDQLAAGVADPLGKDAHTAPCLEHLEQPRERRVIIGRVTLGFAARRSSALLARVHGHRS